MPVSSGTDRPEAMQAAYWRSLVISWQRNAESQLNADVIFDHTPERAAWQ